MSGRALWAIARRDMKVVGRSRAMMGPIIAVPLMLLVVLPGVLLLAPSLGAADPRAAEGLAELLAGLPAELRAQFDGRPPAQVWAMLVHTQLWPPLFLLVPFIVANVIAADSFAGERERHTLESLLYTPPSDATLFAGKLLAAGLPGVLASLFGFLLYFAVVTVIGRTTVGWAPSFGAASLVLVAWVGPAFAAIGLAGMVLVSLRVARTQDAVQLGGLLVLPVIGLVVGSVKGAVVLNAGALLLIGAGAWLVAGALLLAVVRSFRRARLVSRL